MKITVFDSLRRLEDLGFWLVSATAHSPGGNSCMAQAQLPRQTKPKWSHNLNCFMVYRKSPKAIRAKPNTRFTWNNVLRKGNFSVVLRENRIFFSFSPRRTGRHGQRVKDTPGKTQNTHPQGVFLALPAQNFLPVRRNNRWCSQKTSPNRDIEKFPQFARLPKPQAIMC